MYYTVLLWLDYLFVFRFRGSLICRNSAPCLRSLPCFSPAAAVVGEQHTAVRTVFSLLCWPRRKPPQGACATL